MTVIVYVYIGYPLIIACVARLFPQARPEPLSKPEISLIIPAYNEEAVISQKIENCFALDYPKEKLDILVIADGSDDRTVDIVKSYENKGVRLLYTEERQGKTAAVNRAVGFALGEIIVFSDANNMFSRDALQHLMHPFADKEVGAVSGAKIIQKGDGLLGDSEGLYWKYESFIKNQETRVGCCTCVVGEIYAVRKNLLTVWPKSIINDDSYMAMNVLKQGFRIIYTDKARSVERISPSAREEVTRRSRIIAGRLQILSILGTLMPWYRPMVCWMLISHKFLRPFLPFAMLGALLTNLVVVLSLPVEQTFLRFSELSFSLYQAMLVLQITFYCMAVSANFIEQKGAIGKLLYLPKYLVNSNLATLIGWYRFLSQSQTPIWDRVRRL